MFDWLSQDWQHYVPFAALVAQQPIPENRPAMTRILEQSFVGIVAAALGSYVMIQVQATEINSMKLQRLEDEQRITRSIDAAEMRRTAQLSELRAQITELRTVILNDRRSK